jgi:hypothetical protein
LQEEFINSKRALVAMINMESRIAVKLLAIESILKYGIMKDNTDLVIRYGKYRGNTYEDALAIQKLSYY